jgi:small-conductance mechanosensitive channel
MPQTFRLFICAAVTVILTGSAAQGQEVSTPSAPTAPPALPAQGPTPIPLAEIVTQAESASENLHTIEAELAADQIPATINKELPAFTREIDARLEENAKMLTASPPLETLRSLEMGWQKLGESLSAWERDLMTRATQLDSEGTRLITLGETWEQTLELAQRSEAPPEVLQRIRTVINAIKQAREGIETRQAQILILQSRVSKQEARVNEVFAAIKQARDNAVTHLLVKDNPPIWSAEMRIHAGQDLVEESQLSLAAQFTAFGAYVERQKARFFLHAVLCFVLIAMLYRARWQVRLWVGEEPSLKRATRVFESPVATAVVLSLLVSGWTYPQAPRLWWAILGAAALIPTISILRQLIEPHWFPIVNALVVFYLLDQIRAVTSSLQVLSRLVFLGEMCGGILFLAWLSTPARLAKVPEAERDSVWKTIRTATRIALVVFAIAVVANVLGYVSLANLLGNAVLGSAYLAVILYAGVRIVDGLVTFGLRVRPLALLGMVRRHRSLLQRRLHQVTQWLACLFWALETLELLSLRGPLVERITEVLTATLTLGSLKLSLGQAFAFGITVWVAFLLSRFLRFLLEEDIYPRFQLARGVPYVISTMLHYVVLLIGFFLAVAAVGVDMTKFTILAGAFGVGLGFGLQNIVNNFVSGLIVLFERPIKVGDVIQMDDAAGVVARIGIRATVIRTMNGSDIIVPNGKLISDRVTNWTFSNSQRGIELPISVVSGTDPHRVIGVLKGVAAAHPLVIDNPPPQALLVKFGPNALDFELRVWTSRFEEWGQIRSDLAIAINAAFGEEHISVT